VALADGGRVGEQAPVFEATTLDGAEPVTLAEQQGTAVLVNKWATWCRPCVREMPALETLYQKYRGQGFEVIGIAIDRPGSEGAVERVASERGVTYPIWLDPEDDFTPTFRSTGVPESVLIDRNGVVVQRWPGAIQEGDPAVDAAVEDAIASEGSYVEAASERAALSDPAVSFGLLGILVAAAAGLLSFLSPCVLPLVPTYIAFLAGVGGTAVAAEQEGGGSSRRETFAHAVAFVTGFSLVFVILGASATAISGTLRADGEWIARIGGVLLILFGLVLLGAVGLQFFQREMRFLSHARGLRRFGLAGSGIVGAAFGAGWTPCIGPALAAILTLAATSQDVTEGIILLIAYSAGLAIPFLLAAFALSKFGLASARIRRWMPWINRISGALLIGVGILMVTGEMTRLAAELNKYVPSWIP
jgi:cytochrome c-type biogenesis protein